MPNLNLNPEVRQIVERVIQPDGGLIPTDVPVLMEYVEGLLDVEELDQALGEFRE